MQMSIIYKGMDSNMKSAVITGITGQDGAYLSSLLLKNNYRVYGLIRQGNQTAFSNLKYLEIEQKIEFIACDLESFDQVYAIISRIRPDEIYNLAAQSSVGQSFSEPLSSVRFNTVSVLNLLESIRRISAIKPIKFYQASSSELFGETNQLPINEETRVHPLSPYAVSKATGHWTTINYRESYGVFACSGILFNHESYLRKNNFFIKKVILQAIRISKGHADELKVGNIDVSRDFGFAPSYVEAMWLMLQQDEPDDFIICSGKSYSLRNIINKVFDYFAIAQDKIVIDSSLFRPNELNDIYGDSSKARKKLNWNYALDFMDVLELLIEEELKNYESVI
jgi:GDPmannose 4,6-dehydratase